MQNVVVFTCEDVAWMQVGGQFYLGTLLCRNDLFDCDNVFVLGKDVLL